MAAVWVVIITAVITLGIGGGASYYYLDNDVEDGVVTESSSDESALIDNGLEENDDADEALVDTSGWKTLSLSLINANIKYPSDWKISEETRGTEQGQTYSINENIKIWSMASITESDINEWLKGPKSDDAYVMQKDKREKAYKTMQNIFNDRKLSPDSRMELNNYYLEFFSYSAYNRADVKYIESDDGKSRGFTMFNTHGQDAGLSSLYMVSLYNKENQSLITVRMPFTEDFSEITELTDRYGDYSQSADEIVRIDNDVHQDFVDLMLSDREDLSFGDFLNEVDAVAKSVTY